MKKMFLVFSHTLTPTQEADAKKSLGIEHFVTLPKELQEMWSNIPPQLTELSVYLEPLKQWLLLNANTGDMFLVQGDFGATFEMVNFIKSYGFVAVHATTKRDVVEKTVNGVVEKISRFEHVIFRRY
jgi:hypothetical protein